MQFHASTGTKRVTISNGGGAGGGCFWEVMKVKGSTRRFSYRSVLPTVILLGVILPFLYIRTAFLALDSTSFCSSLDCIRWRLGPTLFGGRESSPELREELLTALIEARDEGERGGAGGGGGGGGAGMQGGSVSFNELVMEMTSKRPDIKGFAFKTKLMLMKMERKVQLARHEELIYWHFASYGIPRSIHCLCLKLAEEYSINALARAPLPPPELVSCLADYSYLHIVLLTDNILAASVAVSSAIKNSAHPEKFVFHLVTDKKTYAPMHAWFALNPVAPAVIEVKGLHQFDWPHEVNVGVEEMLEIHRSTWSRYYYNSLREGRRKEFEEGELTRRLDASRPSSFSLLNHLRIYLPELFPELKKIIFLDDDVVVQRDLSPLWELDLNGRVIGAVVNSSSGEGESERNHCSPGRRYGDFLNFSNPLIYSEFEYDHCAWLYGMNVFDLQAWRGTSITEKYHHWLKLNLDSGFTLWRPGALPPALVAFQGHVHPIDPSWHMAGLGQQPFEVGLRMLEDASVIHFSGPAKPWLDIGSPELRNLWNIYLNFSSDFIRDCKIIE
ncbi:PREDICTED: probable galacturonosyltransferase 15 isoform X2 [Nelumbo nucifera]|uniref:Hexosyltransferase n=1 Tax=Nelumbo nucifera TaxID=4432 RepID=A0A1U8AYX3_NELNU|nr:PREDICTED: probable galacturonosyltransferase 15 isoform X2 [Nelumbo nucifera]